MALRHIGLGGLLVLILSLFMGCGSSTAHVSGMPLATVPWCDQPLIAFQDDGVVPAAILTNWPQARVLLGFTPILPTRVPTGACLGSAGGVVRDTVFGGSFTIIYVLPQNGALTIAETPAQHQIPQPQCGAATPATCQQTLNGLNVTISSTLPQGQVQALLASAQPNDAWVPATKQ